MKKIFLPFALFTFLLSSCCKDDGGFLLLSLLLPDVSPSVCDSTNATPYDSRFAVEGYLPTVHLADGSKALFVSPNALYWNDLSTGQMLRKIESPVAVKAFNYPDAIYRHGDVAVASSSTCLAAFNVRTGELAWERKLGDCDIEKGVLGVGNQYFVVRKVMDVKGVSNSAVFVGDLHDGDRLDLLFTPAYSRDTHTWAGYGRISDLVVFAGEDGHAYMLTSFFEPKKGGIREAFFMGLYDITARSWVYERQPINTKITARQLTISGSMAYVSIDNNVVAWELATGVVTDSLLLFEGYNYYDNIIAAGNIWVNDQYLLISNPENYLQFLDKTTLAVLRQIDRPFSTVKVDFELNRLFMPQWGSIAVYELSTGKILKWITAPCELFTGEISVWQDDEGSIQLAAAGRAGNIYRYVLQP